MGIGRWVALLYLTSTDEYSSAGSKPYNSLAAYGAFTRPMPSGNEIRLRMLIGGANFVYSLASGSPWEATRGQIDLMISGNGPVSKVTYLIDLKLFEVHFYS
ncbi:unnamed protein product [Eruca vesicaria subsp. sativa]|uniref:Uncharacterized protein n=1 Tax=Eruca vesicaria subsp. sativa TaxID=29727 RepID=A0ABC8KGD4_ERUVS|nr:unnamed protein product [Eruca vesicaria subsp. sativa]